MIIIIIIFTSICFADESTDIFYQNQDRAIQAYELLQSYGIDNDKISQLSSIPVISGEINDIEFCGAYIDKNGKLVLQLTRENNKIKTEIKKLLKGYDIKIEVQKNANKDLVSLYKELSYNFRAYPSMGIIVSEVYVDVRSNKVVLTVKNLERTDVSVFNKYVKKGLLAIIEAEEINQPTTALVAGKTVYDSDGLRSTLGFSAIRDNIEGVVVAGHANDDGVGEAFRYLINSSSNEIGEVLDTNYGGKSDCAFVELESSNYDLSNDIANGSEFSGTDTTYIYGLGCSTYGRASNEDSGIIIATSVTFTNTEGVTLSDMVKTDIERIPGDSGGPLYRTIVSGSEMLMGTLSSKTTTTSSYSKINNISNDLDLDSIYTQ